jgi:hypothetical protein
MEDESGDFSRGLVERESLCISGFLLLEREEKFHPFPPKPKTAEEIK